jgi:transcriptional regulator NrdR family protein
MQMRVIKADGDTEEYLHTKVIGAISRALEGVDHTDISVAEHLAEVVTYFLYHKQNSRTATSSDILSMVQAVLAATGYEDAALALSEHHFERRLKRSRVEVVLVDVQQLCDAQIVCNMEQSDGRCQWNKSRIVNDLVAKYNLCRQTARTIASMVEEKIFRMEINLVPASLVKQLVLGDTAAVLRAEQQLQPV